ncbi:MAG: Flp pilus assembly complex ATPase component TadA [Candidatus Schekmanbacteria bacterium]|nr:Flp pilus assembly complex ATPase component TadA [Candidatus Schekmanbacteria bacterium]
MKNPTRDTFKRETRKIGELLCDAGLITKEQLEASLSKQKETKKKLGEVFVSLGFIKEIDIAQVLSVQLGISYVDFSSAVVEPEAIQLVTEKICTKHTLIPISVENKIIKAAFADPLDLTAIDELRFITGKTVQPAVSTASQIKEAISHHFHLSAPLQELVKDISADGHIEVIYDADSETELSEIVKKSETAPVISMVNGIFQNAIEHKASDIHITPQQKSLKLKERIDGLLRDVMTLPKWVQGLVISRIKIMAKMDIAEKRIPQDGRIKIMVKKKELDLRVSTLPTQYGENVVIRVLDSRANIFNLEEMGFVEEDLNLIKSMIEKPQGFILVTGPTGSGKSSTLYAMINHIKRESINVVTLEDPIEYELTGLSQVGVNEKVGLTFSFCLRSILRQDPDVIMIGEIRDGETAAIATQASVTGHIVLSSIHTNNAVATISRLKNMGIPGYLIASSLNGVISQRLVRLICENCKTSYKPSHDEFIKIGLKSEDFSDMSFFKGTGCSKCGNTGYKGRIGLFEVLAVNSRIRELISSGASEDVITKAAITSGMSFIVQDGLRKVGKGLTTLAELNRVIVFEEETKGTMICPICKASIKDEFVNCPYCGYSISDQCASCGKQKQPDWHYCPYCKTELPVLTEG